MEEKADLKAPEKLYKIKTKLSSAEDVSLLPSEKVVIADKVGWTVKIFDNCGNYLSSLVTGVHPYGVAASRSGLVAFTHNAGRKSHSVHLYTQDGQKVALWGEDRYWKPWGIAHTGRGQLVISEVSQSKHGVGIYTCDGRALIRFGEKGSGLAQFNHPCYVNVDLMGRILVSDKDNHCVKVFDDQGKFLFKAGRRGTGAGMLKFPRGVASDAQCNILVCDTGNRRISVFSPAGEFIEDLMNSDDGLAYPLGIEYNRNGTLIVSNHNSAGGSSFRKVRAYRVV